MSTPHFGRMSEADLDFMVRELGILPAISYAEQISRVQGPLSEPYEDARRRLLERAVEKGHIQR